MFVRRSLAAVITAGTLLLAAGCAGDDHRAAAPVPGRDRVPGEHRELLGAPDHRQGVAPVPGEDPVAAVVDGVECGQGTAKSKKEAEQEAARQAIDTLRRFEKEG